MKYAKKHFCQLPAALLAIFAMLLLNSCLIPTQPYRRTRTFDLGAAAVTQEQIEVEKFENPNMYRHSFVYRVGDNEIIRDEYNRWAALPENMMASRLRTVFAAPDSLADGTAPVLSGKILRFEFDTKKSLAVLQIAYKIHKGAKLATEGEFSAETAFAENDPSAMAKAMAECLDKFSAEISVKLKSPHETQ